jgi:hypothetical protein
MIPFVLLYIPYRFSLNIFLMRFYLLLVMVWDQICECIVLMNKRILLTMILKYINRRGIVIGIFNLLTT